MYCPNCGVQNEDNAQFCAKCGGALNNNVNASAAPGNNAALFNVVRKKSFYGVAIKMNVSVDGGEPVKLATNQILSYYLVPGEHIVRYKVWNRREKEVRVYVTNVNQIYSLVFKPDWLWGGFKVNEKESILQ